MGGRVWVVAAGGGVMVGGMEMRGGEEEEWRGKGALKGWAC